MTTVTFVDVNDRWIGTWKEPDYLPVPGDTVNLCGIMYRIRSRHWDDARDLSIRVTIGERRRRR